MRGSEKGKERGMREEGMREEEREETESDRGKVRCTFIRNTEYKYRTIPVPNKDKRISYTKSHSRPQHSSLSRLGRYTIIIFSTRF